MSHHFRLVAWDRFKVRYDLAVVITAATFIGAYVVIGALAADPVTAPGPEVLALRATGALAIALLHVILMIGPAARLWPALLPLLYNRRHLGVMTFFVALVHAIIATGYYHGFGNVFPLTSLAAGVGQTVSLGTLPFQLFGAGGLAIMFLLALTSHDFWLKLLTPRWWKRLHVCVYAAYGLLILHVLLGAIQQEKSPLLGALVGAGCAAVIGLQVASRVARARRGEAATREDSEWMPVPAPHTISPGRGTTVRTPAGERIAIFRRDDRLLAISNRCAHQGGPLGEGAIVDGCVTCPWHGHQFDPSTGCAPAPYTDRVPTHALRLQDGRVEVRISASPLGSTQEGVVLPEGLDKADATPKEAAQRLPSQQPRSLFVGYLPMEASTRRGLVMAAMCFVVGLGLIGGVAATDRRAAGPAVWDTQQVQVIEGRVVAEPYPRVVLERTGLGIERGASVLVVEEGKHGAARLRALSGQRVRLKGFGLQRQDWRMLELMPGEGAIEVLGAAEVAGPQEREVVSAEVSLIGEIVDSKCYLGAMRPGEGIVHRACAILCVQGGIPPVLVIRRTDSLPGQGQETLDAVVIAESDGAPLTEKHRNLIGLLVEVKGRLTTADGLGVLSATSIQVLKTGDLRARATVGDGAEGVAVGVMSEICGR